jgi:hypothetical protein
LVSQRAFYKTKCKEGLKGLDEILKNIERNQAETQRLKEQTEESLKRLKSAMNKFKK